MIGVNQKLMKMMIKMTIRVIENTGGKSDTFIIKIGLKHDDLMSPVLFNFVLSWRERRN